MKNIQILIICMLMISTMSVSATTISSMPQLNLQAQMAKQEQINKKNAIATRLMERTRIQQEARDRALALKYERLVRKNANLKPITPSVSIVPSSPLVIKRPPEITPIKVNPNPVINTNIPIPSNIDISRVRSSWISWYNSVRQSEGLGSYSYDTRLDSTAYDWNTELAKGKGLNHHTRNTGDGYYNFAIIDQWFINRGINPKVINRSKHTENVGYGYYNCNSGDCTNAMIQSIRSTFDFFMSEKGKSYDAHYRSIVNPYFTKIGLSIIVVPGENRYYLTVHYITE